VKKILREAVDLRAQKISFGGGEPTVAPHFLETLRETIRLGFAAEVFTSGVMFDHEQHASPFSDEFIQNLSTLGGMLSLVFSFHGSCGAVHDSITGVRGSFDWLIDSLRKCLSCGISCAANFVPVRVNAPDFENTVRILESLGVAKLSILRFVPQGRGLIDRRGLELSREEEERFVEDLVDLRIRTRIEIRTGSPFNGIIPGNNVPCRAAFHKLVIQPDGNVLPCEVFKHHERCDWDASVFELRMKDALELPQFVSLRKALLESRCAICPIHSTLRAHLSNEESPRGLSHAAV
jgi:radical SAM protein with 4Fe4S-binding SPASM domain